LAPELSVIVPCLGRLDAFERLMASFAHQTLARERYEVIVVDDGNDPPLVDSVEPSLLEGVRVVAQANTGPAGAKNLGLRYAKGRIVMFLNADALLGPTTLERHLAWHPKSGGDGVQRAVLGRFDATPNCWTAIVDLCERDNIYFPEQLMVPKARNSGRFFITCNISLPTMAVRRAGGFDQRFRRPMFEDVEFGVRLDKQQDIGVWWDPDIPGGHDHPMYLDGFLKHAWMMGHEWVRLARKHGTQMVPAVGGARVLDGRLARQFMDVLVANARAIERSTAELGERLKELDGLLAENRSAFDSAIDAERPRLVDALNAINSNEPSRGTMDALFGFTEWDTRRAQARAETLGVVSGDAECDHDIVVRVAPGQTPSPAALSALRTHLAVSPAVGAVAVRPSGSGGAGARVDDGEFPASDAVVGVRRECLEPTSGALDASLGAQVRAHGRVAVTAWEDG